MVQTREELLKYKYWGDLLNREIGFLFVVEINISYNSWDEDLKKVKQDKG